MYGTTKDTFVDAILNKIYCFIIINYNIYEMHNNEGLICSLFHIPKIFTLPIISCSGPVAECT